MAADPQHTISKATVCPLMKQAYDHAFRRGTVAGAFEATGIMPWNPLSIHPKDFAPSAPFDKVPSVSTANGHPLSWISLQNMDTQESSTEIVQTPVSTTIHTPPPTHTHVPVTATNNAQSRPSPNSHPLAIAINQASIPTHTEEPTLTINDTFATESSSTPAATQSIEGILSHDVMEVEVLMDNGPPLTVMLPVMSAEVPSENANDKWSDDIHEMFGPPVSKQEQNIIITKKVTGHRLLTSDEFITMKEEQKQRKEELARQKEDKTRRRIALAFEREEKIRNREEKKDD
jgi:hypothetical protein